MKWRENIYSLFNRKIRKAPIKCLIFIDCKWNAKNVFFEKYLEFFSEFPVTFITFFKLYRQFGIWFWHIFRVLIRRFVLYILVDCIVLYFKRMNFIKLPSCVLFDFLPLILLFKCSKLQNDFLQLNIANGCLNEIMFTVDES